MSLWGSVVITSLASAIPVIGQPIVNWLWGGFAVDNPTLNRFYSAHYLFPFLLAGLSIFHLGALHQYGSSNPLGVNAKVDKIPFYPYYVTKDVIGIMWLCVAGSLLVFFYPDLLSHPDNNVPANAYSTPAHIVPEYIYCSLICGTKALFICRKASAAQNHRFSLNPTRCGNLLITKEITRASHPPVKIFLLNGQSARGGHGFSKNYAHAAAILQQMPSLQRLNVGHPDGFIDWLVGLIDGDGCFYFAKSKKGTWVFSFKVSQSNYNMKLLGYLKKKLHCGSVKPVGRNSSQYYLRNPYLLNFFLLSKFSGNPFLTRKKAWQYSCFKKALNIYCQAFLQPSILEQNALLEKVLEQSRNIPADFRVSHPQNDSSYPSLGWLIGFSEVEGSFFLNLKGPGSIMHGVIWSQKDEKELLERMKFKLGISGKVSISYKGEFSIYKLGTYSSRVIQKIIPLFEGKMKGMKAVEVRKWARSFRNDRGNFSALYSLQQSMR